MISLTELQRDALIEIFNIGVGNAANSLSLIIHDEVKLSAPKLEIVLHDHEESLAAFVKSQRICAVSQNFTGPIEAESFLVFPEGKSQDVVRRMLGELVSADELNTMEEEALIEIGNIILNACISSMSDMLKSQFESSLPLYHLGTASDILAPKTSGHSQFILLLHIDFSLPNEQIDGYLFFLLSLQSFSDLTQKIDLFLSEI